MQEHERLEVGSFSSCLLPLVLRLTRWLTRRTTELFDIIVSYPDTLPALEDLKECLAKVDSRDNLVAALKASSVAISLAPLTSELN